MKLNIKNYNFVLELPENKRTGTCVVSKHFKEENHVLYDKGNRLSYLHYIGIPSQAFKKACSGRNIGFPYRDIFMYYRYLNQPEKMPKFKGKARPYEQKPTLIRRVLRKVRSII